MEQEPIQKQNQSFAPESSQESFSGTNSMSPPPFQLKASAGGESGADSSGGSDLISGFAQTTGHDLSDVKVNYNSDKPSQVGALAYAQGNEVNLGPGQEKHLPHEMAHVVQQREGRVKANTEVNGMAVNDNPGLESEADRMGDQAMQAKADPSAGPLQKKAASGPVQMKAGDGVIQRVEQESHWGKFIDTKYELDGTRLDADFEFEPGDNVDATKIAFSQAVQLSEEGNPVYHDPTQENKLVDDGSDADGYRIDRLSTANNPVYGAPSLPEGDEIGDTSGSNSKFRLGHRFDNAGTIEEENAFMHDKPGGLTNGSRMIFETTALAVEGSQEGTYYGSFTWGWSKNDSGDITVEPFTLESEGTPSNRFMAAAQAWNDGTARGTVSTSAADTVAYNWEGGAYVEDYQLPAGIEVRRISARFSDLGVLQKSEILTGDHAGDERYFKVVDLRDQGDGAATADLPIEDIHEVISPVTLNEGVPGPFANFGELSAGDRVKILDDSHAYGPHLPDFAYGYKVLVEVVQGSQTGAMGWIPAAALRDENANVG